MPRIPSYESAGTNVARTSTPRYAPDRSSEIEQEGQQAVLGAVGAAVDQAVAHDDKLRYAEARSSLLQANAAIRKELEADGDYETFEKRYTERITKARSAAAGNIRGARSREIFEADAQADIDRGLEQIRGMARGVEVDKRLAQLSTNLEANRTLALETKDPKERAALLKSSLDNIAGAAAPDKRYIKESEAVAMGQKYATSIAEGLVSIQPPAQRIAMLSKPDDNEARYIAPDRRNALLEAAKRENEDVRVRGESQAYFDNLVAKYGNNFKGAIREARESLKGDPVVRDATEVRLAQEQVRVRQFERDDREAAAEEAVAFVDGGGKIEDLPTDTNRRLGPAGRKAVRNYAKNGGAPLTSDAQTWKDLTTMYGNVLNGADDAQRFGDLDLDEYRDRLSAEDLKQLRDWQTAVRIGKVGGKDTGYQTIVQARDARLRDLFKATKGDGEVGKQIDDFVTKFEARQRAFTQENNRRPKIEEARAILDDMTAEVVTKEGFFSDTKKRAYQLTDEDVDVPELDRREIISNLRARGIPITAKEIRSRYEKQRSKMFEKPAP